MEYSTPGEKRDRRKIRNRVVAKLAIEASVRCNGAGKLEQDGISVGIGALPRIPRLMLLPAPGLFSINTCWPHIAEKLLSASMRATISVGPPAPTGTMTRTGFVWVAGFRRLRVRRERPRCRDAAEQSDEFSPSHV